jgi:hypothetical protein
MSVSPMGARLSISAGPPGRGLSTGDFEVWVQGLWGRSGPLYGCSVKGNWRGHNLLGSLEVSRKSLEMGISSIGAPIGELGGGPVYWGL